MAFDARRLAACPPFGRRIAAAAAVAAAFAAAPSQAQQITMKFATQTINDVQHEFIKVYKTELEKATNGRVKLQMLPKQWVSTPVIAANRSRDVVHRTVGPGGLVLIGEGEPGRVRQLLAGEVRKHERVAYGVTVHTIVMGDKEGQVPLGRLADHIRKLPKSLQPNQVTDVRARLRALDAVRPTVPVPKGPMPTSARQAKGSRQAMRGR